MVKASWCARLATLALYTSTSALSYQDTISANNLIGDYFGIPSFNQTFDYVIIGGGTAGLTLASRLSRNGSFSVAVVEAGDFYEFSNGNQTSIPGYAATLTGTAPVHRNPLIDWGYQTEYDEGLGRNIFYSSGKTFGGGSARNYLVYTRGSRGSYDRWADEIDDQSYKFDTLLPYFQRSVALQEANNDLRPENASISANPAAFGSEGPVHVSYPNWANSFASFGRTALNELGFLEVPDFVSGSLIGQQYTAFTLDRDTQTRSSSETAFLRPALGATQKLTIYKSTLGKKIIFDEQLQATGVLVDTGNVQYTLSARNEVILSAGVHRSPQLLMVSGIGPRETLEKFDIQVLSELPGVGQNMWDQPFYGLSYPVNVVTHSRLGSDPLFAFAQVLEYNANRTGILTNTGSDYLAYEKLPEPHRSALNPDTVQSLNALPDDWPDVQYTIVDAFSGNARDVESDSPTEGRMYSTILLTLVAPFSRGNVTVGSTDTGHNPLISPNLLNDRRDQEVAIQSFKRIRELFNTTSLGSVVTGHEAFPGFNVTSDQDILNAIMDGAAPIWHASCTNKMGQENDSMAVVDSKARVFGVGKLRVVDASAFPFLPPAHPSSTVYALAEKIAGDILNGS